MFSIETLTPPESTPISVDELTEHLRLNDPTENSLLEGWISAATTLFEGRTGYILVDSEYRLNLDHWPPAVIYIPRQPVTEVSLVEYLDPDGDWRELDSDHYGVDVSGVPARVVFEPSFTYPGLHASRLPTVRVTFRAGHDADVPTLAAQWVKLVAAYWYGQRESHTDVNYQEVPVGYEAIISQYVTGVREDWNER